MLDICKNSLLNYKITMNLNERFDLRKVRLDDQQMNIPPPTVKFTSPYLCLPPSKLKNGFMVGHWEFLHMKVFTYESTWV